MDVPKQRRPDQQSKCIRRSVSVPKRVDKLMRENFDVNWSAVAVEAWRDALVAIGALGEKG